MSVPADFHVNRRGPVLVLAPSREGRLAHLAETKRVRVNALCPQFTDTALVGAQFDALGKEKAEALLAQTGGSLLRVDQVVDAAMELVRDDAPRRSP